MSKRTKKKVKRGDAHKPAKPAITDPIDYGIYGDLTGKQLGNMHSDVLKRISHLEGFRGSMATRIEVDHMQVQKFVERMNALEEMASKAKEWQDKAEQVAKPASYNPHSIAEFISNNSISTILTKILERINKLEYRVEDSRQRIASGDKALGERIDEVTLNWPDAGINKLSERQDKTEQAIATLTAIVEHLGRMTKAEDDDLDERMAKVEEPLFTLTYKSRGVDMTRDQAITEVAKSFMVAPDAVNCRANDKEGYDIYLRNGALGFYGATLTPCGGGQ